MTSHGHELDVVGGRIHIQIMYQTSSFECSVALPATLFFVLRFAFIIMHKSGRVVKADIQVLL